MQNSDPAIRLADRWRRRVRIFKLFLGHEARS